MAVKSIQVQTTRLTGAGVTTVSYLKKLNDNERPTNWSIYLRDEDHSVEWVMDLNYEHANPSRSYAVAMVEAAKLSMHHQVPIERVF